MCKNTFICITIPAKIKMVSIDGIKAVIISFKPVIRILQFIVIFIPE